MIDRPEDRGETMEADTGNQTVAEEAVDAGAEATDGGDGGVDREVRGDAVRRLTEAEPRATEGASPVGAVVQPLDPSRSRLGGDW